MCWGLLLRRLQLIHLRDAAEIICGDGLEEESSLLREFKGFAQAF